MILNISDNAFKDIFSNKQFQLPIRWDGVDFEKALKELFNEYCFQVCNRQESNCQRNAYGQSSLGQAEKILSCKKEDCEANKIKIACEKILRIVNAYLNGFPSKAYNIFKNLMKDIIRNPITIYPKSGWTSAFKENDPLSLFRGCKCCRKHNPTKKSYFSHTV